MLRATNSIKPSEGHERGNSWRINRDRRRSLWTNNPKQAERFREPTDGIHNPDEAPEPLYTRPKRVVVDLIPR
jgi:hypothetical protein